VAKSIKVGLEAGFIFIGSSYIYIKKKNRGRKNRKIQAKPKPGLILHAGAEQEKNKLRGAN
jgi:hypothetical protein